MKKAITFLLAIGLCITLTACTNSEAEDTISTEPQTTQSEPETTKLPEVSTTKAPENDSQKGGELKASVEQTLGDGEIDGDLSHGSFKFSKKREAAATYAFEHSEDMETRAKTNAEALVSEIKNYYSDSIKLYSFEAEQIGSGENGIDSVRYKFYYINTQNQLLLIYADSDGIISFAECSFTW